MKIKAVQRGLCILERIERFWLLVFGISPPRGKARLFFLDMAAVGQNKPAQICRCFCAKNPPAKPRPDQCRQISRMVQMSMGEQHSVDGVDTHRERFAIARPQLLEALEQPAIDQNAPPQGLDQIARSRHRPGGAKKAQFRTCGRDHVAVPLAAMAL